MIGCNQLDVAALGVTARCSSSLRLSGSWNFISSPGAKIKFALALASVYMEHMELDEHHFQ